MPLPPRLREPFDVRRFARSFWISPRLHPDFAWAWLTRFLVNLGNALGLLYLLYFMQDVIGLLRRRGRGPGLRADRDLRRDTVLTTVVFGIWSDRPGGARCS